MVDLLQSAEANWPICVAFKYIGVYGDAYSLVQRDGLN